MMFLGEHRAKPDRLSDLLPWAALVAPGVVLNKDGSFLRVIKFRGPDLDSATEPQVVVANAQLNNALKRLGGGWALFVEARRFHAADYLPEGSFPDPVSWLVDAERREAFEHEGQAFDTAYHLTLQYLPPTGRPISMRCSPTARSPAACSRGWAAITCGWSRSPAFPAAPRRRCSMRSTGCRSNIAGSAATCRSTRPTPASCSKAIAAAGSP